MREFQSGNLTLANKCTVVPWTSIVQSVRQRMGSISSNNISERSACSAIGYSPNEILASPPPARLCAGTVQYFSGDHGTWTSGRGITVQTTSCSLILMGIRVIQCIDRWYLLRYARLTWLEHTACMVFTRVSVSAKLLTAFFGLYVEFLTPNPLHTASLGFIIRLE